MRRGGSCPWTATSSRTPADVPALIVGVLVAVMLAGCAATPGRETQTPMPDWVASPPQQDATQLYFTGSGSSNTGDPAEAEQIARRVVIDEIMHYLGSTITAETTAVARASLDDFKADIVQQLTSEASGKVAGLRIAQRWIDKREEAVTVYLLAQYSIAEFQKEQQRLEDLYTEKVEAILRPQRAAVQLEQEGLYVQATIKAIEAAVSASRSDLDDAVLKFSENVNRAKQALQQVNLIALNETIEVEAGEEVGEPFRIKVASGADEDSRGLEGVDLHVTYSELSSAGRKRFRYQTIQTDAEGIATFLHPPPDFVGEETVIVAIDLSAYLSALEEVPEQQSAMVEGLTELVTGKRLSLRLVSVSRAKEIATGVAIVDVDEAGQLLERTSAADGVLESLTGKQFSVQLLAIDAEAFVQAADADIQALLAESFAETIERAIYGVARIVEAEQDGDATIVKASIVVKAIELDSGSVLLTVEKTKSAVGRSASAAMATALRRLGEDVGEYIANNLR